MRIVVPRPGRVDRLADLGVDLAEYKKPVETASRCTPYSARRRPQALRDLGFDVRGAISDQTDYAEPTRPSGSAAIAAADALARPRPTS